MVGGEKYNLTMKKPVIILSILALIAGGCKEKTTPKSEATSPQVDTLYTPQQVEARQETTVNQNSLEDAIIKTIKAYQNQDEKTLNELISKDFGIAFVYRPGVMDDFSVSDKISFSKPVPDYMPFDCNIITDYKVHFEELPGFDCNEDKWNKPPGIYCDTINPDKTLSDIAKLRNEYAEGNWSAAAIQKFEEIEKNSRKIIVIGKEGNEFVFVLTSRQNNRYLSIIVRFEACSA